MTTVPDVYAHVPAVFERFMRYSPGFDGTLETTCGQGPVQSARSCTVGRSLGRYTHLERSRPSRRAEMRSYLSPYQDARCCCSRLVLRASDNKDTAVPAQRLRLTQIACSTYYNRICAKAP